MANLSKTYNPKDFEAKLYAMWEEGGYFRATPEAGKEPYTIALPPPNITGNLHLGHALDHTLQDILIRHKRMAGYNALWQPGTDHASIATEVKVVEKIRETEGKTKEDLGREEFLKRAWQWREEYGRNIVSQMKQLGDSCDWEKERFTMDEGCNKAVTEFFVRLYEEGHIYRGNRIINWCTDCHTSLSDAEVEHEEENGKFYHFKYYFADSEEYIEVATTRPETILGDTAVAVHPEDPRYVHLAGKMLKVPMLNREIPLILDSYVEQEFGTGVVKITPSHDPNDFEVGLRHDLPQIKVIDEDGIMTEEAGKYCGMTKEECRKAIVADMQASGQMIVIKDHVHNVGHCYRCHTTVEPMLSRQWFVKMKDLAQPAIEVLEEGKLTMVPPRFDKIYLNWLNNIRDWCISRQLWWGHRIPAYYCQDCDEIIVSKTKPEICPKCGSNHILQDEDVLDTWFSSALWPFSTLGWPEETANLRHFFPTDVLVTGYDIIFFWVIRMVFSSLFCTGEVPFHHVFIHGLMRDAQGRKMAKSLGNGIDPLEIIDTYGADALRFTLATGNSPGNDMRFYMERVEASRNFANKLWNASRFIFMNLEKWEGPLPSAQEAKKYLQLSDKWILSRLNSLIADVTENIDKYELALAAEKIYEFTWSEFCDWYIELVKSRLFEEDTKSKGSALWTLTYVLENILKLLHPFMPFITEEIYTYLEKGERIIVASWPKYKEEENFKEEEDNMTAIMEAIRAVRNLRSEMNVHPAKKTMLQFSVTPALQRVFEEGKEYFLSLASGSALEFMEEERIEKHEAPSTLQKESEASQEESAGASVAVVIAGGKIYLPLAELIDFDKERERLTKEKEKLEDEIQRSASKLTNQGFLAKAPKELVDAEESKKIKYEEMLEDVLDRLKTLGQ